MNSDIMTTPYPLLLKEGELKKFGLQYQREVFYVQYPVLLRTRVVPVIEMI